MAIRKRWRLRLGALGLVAGVAVLGIVLYREGHQEALRNSCRNNLAMIGLALSNYESVHGSFPLAAFPPSRQPVEARQSWELGALPYMFCLHCWGLGDCAKIDDSGAWEPDALRRLTVVPLEPMLCPAGPVQPATGTHSGFHYVDRSRLTEPVPTTYVGISGVGKDAAFLPKSDRNAGVFGYDRVTSTADITDGLAATMMIAETSEVRGAWTAGGPATVRGVDPARRPYLGKGRPFGGNHRDGAWILCADGSAHFVRATVDPKVFEALATIAGGEDADPGWSPR